MMIRLIWIWLKVFGFPTRPAWFARWMRHGLDDYNIKHVVPLLLGAQAQQSCIRVVWAEPDTPLPELVDWLDCCVAEAHMPQWAALDLFRIAVAHCSEENWETSGNEVHLAQSDILADWIGHRSDWQTQGRTMIIAAIPTQHAGLCLLVDGADKAVRTAFSAQHMAGHVSIPRTE